MRAKMLDIFPGTKNKYSNICLVITTFQIVSKRVFHGTLNYLQRFYWPLVTPAVSDT